MKNNKNREFVRTLHGMIADFLRDNPDIDRSYYQEIWDWLEKKEDEESEDERIREWLVDYFKKVGKSWIHRDISPEQVISYLEKQKEPSMSAEEVLIKAGLKPYKDGNKWCILAGDNIQEGICGFGDTIDEALYQFLMEVCDKQKVQKPVNWTELNWEDINKLEVLINNVHNEYPNGIGQKSFGEEVLERFREYKGDEDLDGKEQKPTDLLDEIKHYLATTPKEQLRKDREEIERWYKEHMVQTQDECSIEEKPAEWSKDERIRKALVSIVKGIVGADSCYFSDNVVSKNEVLAYLERQKEQKPDEEIKQAMDDIHNFKIAVTNLAKTFNIRIDHDCDIDWHNFCASLLTYLKRHAEWSEGEEKTISFVIDVLRANHPDGFFKTSAAGDIHVTGITTEELIKKLKSLLSHPKPSGNWKPSEDQIKALDKAIPVCMGVVGRDKIMPLESLYEDLKKL